jgi:hypothetical protein
MVLSFSWRGFPLVLRGPWPRRQGTGAFAPYPLGRARRPPKENGRIAGGLKTKQPGNDKWAAQRVGAAAIAPPRVRAAATSAGLVPLPRRRPGVAGQEMFAGMFETSSAWGNHLIGF